MHYKKLKQTCIFQMEFYALEELLKSSYKRPLEAHGEIF